MACLCSASALRPMRRPTGGKPSQPSLCRPARWQPSPGHAAAPAAIRNPPPRTRGQRAKVPLMGWEVHHSPCLPSAAGTGPPPEPPGPPHRHACGRARPPVGSCAPSARTGRGSGPAWPPTGTRQDHPGRPGWPARRARICTRWTAARQDQPAPGQGRAHERLVGVDQAELWKPRMGRRTARLLVRPREKAAAFLAGTRSPSAAGRRRLHLLCGTACL